MAQSRKRSFKVIGFAVAYMVTLAALIIGGLQAQASAPTNSVPSDPASKIAPQVIKDTANCQPAPISPNTVEWGVQRVNAPAVWALGYTGQGMVIGNADTGMQWDHPALKPHYRGWNGSTDQNYNWWDAIHNSTGNPCGNN